MPGKNKYQHLKQLRMPILNYFNGTMLEMLNQKNVS